MMVHEAGGCRRDPLDLRRADLLLPLERMRGIDLAAGFGYPAPAIRMGIDLWVISQIPGREVATQELVHPPHGFLGSADQILVANREEVGPFEIGSDPFVVLQHQVQKFISPATILEPLGGIPQGSGVAHVVDDPGIGEDRKEIFEVADVPGPLVAGHAGAAATREIGEGGGHGLPKTGCGEKVFSGQSTQGPSEERLRLGIPDPRPASDVRFGKTVPAPFFRVRVEDAGPRAGPEGVAFPEARDLGMLIEHAGQQRGARFLAPDTEKNRHIPSCGLQWRILGMFVSMGVFIR